MTDTAPWPIVGNVSICTYPVRKEALPLAPPIAQAYPHILSTEDDSALREVLAALFADEGYRVTFAATHSVDEVAALAPDLVLLDGQGHGCDSGWAFLGRLRADPTTAAVPVVMLTAESRAADNHAGHLAELNAVLIAKPFDIDDLLDQIRERLDAPRLHHSLTTISA